MIDDKRIAELRGLIERARTSAGWTFSGGVALELIQIVPVLLHEIERLRAENHELGESIRSGVGVKE